MHSPTQGQYLWLKRLGREGPYNGAGWLLSDFSRVKNQFDA